ncbi:MAG: Ig-like domain-containing protein [Lachnospiraceae bacterium]|nr:Ig-like domain-containing protein [Lachnospiraceae bacterium]
MLNLKKGLALVLAAATAFTFAPVANLGAPVKAEAAETTALATPEKGTIELYANGTNNTATFTIKDLSGLTDDDGSKAAGVTATIADTKVATITNAVNNQTPTPGSYTVTGGGAEVTGLKKGDKVTVTLTSGAEVGKSTTITFKFANISNMGFKYTQTVNLHVGAVTTVLDVNKSTLKATRTKVVGTTSYFKYQFDKDTEVAEASAPVSIASTLTAKVYNIPSGKYDQIEVTSTNPDAVAFDGTNPINVAEAESKNIPLKIKALGDATISIRVFQYDDADHTKNKTLIAEKSVTATVVDGIDTLTVSYDGNKTGKNSSSYSLSTSSTDVRNTLTGYYTNPNSNYFNNSTVTATASTSPRTFYNNENNAQVEWKEEETATSPSTWQWVAQSKTLNNTDTIYLDANTNETAKLTTSDANGRQRIFTSTNPGVAVDQNGNISLTKNAFDNNNTSSLYTVSSTIYVTVPKTGSGKGTSAELTIAVPVVYTKTDATTLTVRAVSNQKILAQMVGSNNNYNSDMTKLPTIYLSTQDKKSDKITVESKSGAVYSTGVVYKSTSDDRTLSDKVQYDNATGTVSLKDNATAGEALLVLTAYNNGSNVNTKTNIYLRVVVSNKKAAGVITADPATITLNAVNNTAKVAAKSTYPTTLHYEFVKEIGSDDKTSSGDLTLGEYTGNITYTGRNAGSAVIRISGYETADALAPAEAWVTVNYSADKNAQTITVDPASVNLKAGETAQINAKSVVSGAALTYKSSDETVATVDATGKVTAVAAGNATITVSAPATDTFAAGTATVAVKVTSTAPAKVTGLKVKNAKGAKVSVTWNSQDKNVQYRVYKKVGNGKWIAKNVTKGKASLSVKKGAKVQVKVKSFVKDADGTTVWGPKAAKKTLKTDKK